MSLILPHCGKDFSENGLGKKAIRRPANPP
jgi:hypothetical protein